MTEAIRETTFEHVPAERGDREIRFHTSGSTSDPVVWWRTESQLRAEADVLARELPHGIDQVVNFAPTEHLFGRITGEFLPEKLSAEVVHLDHEPARLPDSVRGKRVLLACLPSSWLILRRLLSQLRDLPAVTALHGTGPTVGATDEVVSALQDTGFRATEVFGSTETGGIACRRICPDHSDRQAWTLLPDVEFHESTPESDDAAEREWLAVRSPRLGYCSGMSAPPDHWELSDLVYRKGPRSFEFEGRGSDLVKVNGRRLDLTLVAEALRTALTGIDVVCLPVHDSVRGEHYELFYQFHRHLGREWILDELRATIDDPALPRAVHKVRRIPRTPTGKVSTVQLYAQIEPDTDTRPQGHDIPVLP
ncbi:MULTISPECIES: acyl-CoA synthetase [unclassified Actinopolyspora]|uniref:acyl-CoA synthetase n=1 Tax=unclassified Actinopolyspora TaxID=2639451 RepID=UPI0013F63ED9|nr:MULTISPECIES: acyl-CoA synthetase [unclassified Actinopolyspora]NHD19426.1 acyl-CoA synthetase [Actinopolyspora sp. BKK2]NHE78501.1 acyl-CoA synthetase [Actinopolyspora sp. BKK1]